MATTRSEISSWFDRMITAGATHMIVVCDTFDWDDYPVYVFPEQNIHRTLNGYNNKNMQRVMEVYSAALPKEDQLNERRAYHVD